jgi:hypothetical protein
MKIANLVLTTVTLLLGIPLLAQQPALPVGANVDLALAEDKAAAESDAAIPGGGQLFAPGGKNNFGGAAAAQLWAGAANRTPANQVSVLCFKEPDQKQLRETTEDIAVLAFLLSKNLDQATSDDAGDYKLGIHIMSGNQSVGASYIQDFGALLKLQVRFPVAAPANARVERPAAQTSSDWEIARKELQDQDSGNDFFPPAPKHRAEGQPYDPALVQTLQKRILALLKNAANIRHLKDNEWIIIKVVGTPSSSIIARVTEDKPIGDKSSEPGESKPPAAPSKKGSRNAGAGPKFAHTESITQNQTTVLTLRVKKSDINAFAAGSLSPEQFTKSAEVAAYFNPAPNEGDARNMAFDAFKLDR